MELLTHTKSCRTIKTKTLLKNEKINISIEYAVIRRCKFCRYTAIVIV